MAGRIKGITVEIGGDTTKLQTALKGVNSEIKNTQSQLKDVEKLLKLDPGNTELLAQKQKALSTEIGATKEKLTTLKTAAEQANQALANGDITQGQYDALQREIVDTEEKLKSLENEYRNFGSVSGISLCGSGRASLPLHLPSGMASRISSPGYGTESKARRSPFGMESRTSSLACGTE